MSHEGCETMNLEVYLLEWARLLWSIFIMGITALMDLKTREVRPELWVIAIVVGTTLMLFEMSKVAFIFFAIYILLSLAPLPVLIYMMLKGGLGGADVLAYLFLSLTLPYSAIIRTVLPIPLVVLFYASLIMLPTSLIRLLRNLTSKEFMEHLEARGIKGKTRLSMLISGKLVSVEEYLKMKFWYPLEEIRESEEGVNFIPRGRFDVEEEDAEHKRKIRELVEKGKLSPSEKIIVSYGIPFLVNMFLGLLLVILIKDIPLCIMFGEPWRCYGLHGG